MAVRRTARYLLLAVALWAAGMAGYALGRARERDTAALGLEAQYQRAFLAYVQHVQNAESLLAKALASSSPGQQVLLLTRVRAEADAAAESLAQLPVGVELAESRRVLAQTGDVAYALALDLAAGQAPSPQEWQLLNRLHTTAASLVARLTALQAEALREGWRWTDLERRLAGTARAGDAAVPAAAPVPAATADVRGDVADGLRRLDQELQQVPVPAYDGPLSIQNVERAPRASLGPAIDAAAAEARARRYAGGALQRLAREELGGELPGWVFTFRRTADTPGPLGGRRGDRVTVAVSRAGGRLLWLLVDGPPGGASRPRLDRDAARRRAQEVLRGLGFGPVEVAGWIQEGDTLTATLVPVARLPEVVGGPVPGWARARRVLLYPDALHVTVDQDGRVLAMDARAYWLHRHRRALPAPRLTEAQARAAANPALTVRGARLAVVPLPSGREVLAWELRADLREDTFLVYLDARDGREHVLLRLVETAGARLTQ